GVLLEPQKAEELLSCVFVRVPLSQLVTGVPRYAGILGVELSQDAGMKVVPGVCIPFPLFQYLQRLWKFASPIKGLGVVVSENWGIRFLGRMSRHIEIR